MASTISIQSVLNLCSTHADLLPLSGVGGYTNEPALSLCNDALSEIINDANDWKWNSVELISTVQPLITMMNKQSYLFAGASAFVLNTNPTNQAAQAQSSGVSIDLASNNAITVAAGVVTVNTLETHRFKVGYVVNLIGVSALAGNSADATKYNSVFTDDGSTSTWSTGYAITAVTSTSFSFAAVSGMVNGDVLGAPGITNFGWLTSASMLELNNNSSPANQRQLKAVRNVAKWSKVADPEQVAMVQDLGTGVLKFRLYYTPGSTVWAVNLVYQKAAPVLTSLLGTWAPIPDMFGSMIRQALFYRMYRYLSSPTANAEYQKLQAEIAKAKGRDQAEQSNLFLEPESLVDYGPGWVGF
jgi:hypothetical protein